MSLSVYFSFVHSSLQVWISDDSALMDPTYDSTGASHVVCAGPDSVDGLTAYQMRAEETDVEVVCNGYGRFVRVQLLGEPRALAVVEVEFFTGGWNGTIIAAQLPVQCTG